MAYFSQAQLDREVSIESERILTVLDNTLLRMELALRLPVLLEDNMKRLRPFLRDDLLEIVGKCIKVPQGQVELNELGEEVVTTKRKMEGAKASRVTMASGDSTFNMATNKKHHDPDTSRAIHILCSKPKRLQKILHQAELSEKALQFITFLRGLRDFVYQRLLVTPAMEHARGMELRQAWLRNEHAKEETIILRDQLSVVKKENDKLISAKNNTVEKFKSNIAKIIYDCKHDCKKIVSDSEKHMVGDCKNVEFRREILTQDVKTSSFKLSALLAEHLHSEKELRAKRYKVETQLASWLEKYDNDIGEKQAEWEEIEAGFSQEREQMAVLQEEFDAQEEEYEVLMAEKEAEYQLELEEKMYAFLFNRSARRIQRYWRAYRERKRARRKARRSRKRSKSAGSKAKGGGKKK